MLKSDNINIRTLLDKQYFDAEIIMPLISKDEIFVDAGCFNCDIAIQFVKNCKNEYAKIIAFEPNPKQYPICVEKSESIKNITLYPYGLWNDNVELNFDNSNNISEGSAHITDKPDSNVTKIKGVKLDDVLSGEKATFIKMDIEGAELNALKGAEYTITKFHPKLAICVYHKPEDIWQIPDYINSLNMNYKFYLRHYNIMDTETVLYAV